MCDVGGMIGIGRPMSGIDSWEGLSLWLDSS